jgi:hypothetical protein
MDHFQHITKLDSKIIQRISISASQIGMLSVGEKILDNKLICGDQHETGWAACTSRRKICEKKV